MNFAVVPTPPAEQEELTSLGLTLREARRVAGFTIVELLVATVALALVISAGVQSLLHVNRRAAESRVMTSARAVLQRNIDTALRVPFSESETPALLALTGGSAASVPIVMERDGRPQLSGELTRIVAAQPTPGGIDAIIRRVTFRISYVQYGRRQTLEMTTLRAIDQ